MAEEEEERNLSFSYFSIWQQSLIENFLVNVSTHLFFIYMKSPTSVSQNTSDVPTYALSCWCFSSGGEQSIFLTLGPSRPKCSPLWNALLLKMFYISKITLPTCSPGTSKALGRFLLISGVLDRLLGVHSSWGHNSQFSPLLRDLHKFPCRWFFELFWLLLWLQSWPAYGIMSAPNTIRKLHKNVERALWSYPLWEMTNHIHYFNIKTLQFLVGDKVI